MPGPGNALNITQAGLVKFDGISTFTGVTVTQHNVLVGSSSNAITSVSPSTAGYVFTSNGTGSDPSFQPSTSFAIGANSIAVRLSNGVNDVTGDGTNYTMIFDTIGYDPGSNYNVSTGVFTVPATGIYSIQASVAFNSISSDFTYYQMMIAGNFGSFLCENVAIGAIAEYVAGASNGQYVSSNNLTWVFTKDDTIEVQVAIGGSTKTVGVTGNTGPDTCYFMCTYLGSI